MRLFHLAAKDGTARHTDWNGCTPDRRCQVWADGGEDRARAIAHAKFWQASTPVDPDQSSPWMDPELVICEEAHILPGMTVPSAEEVFGWDGAGNRN